MIQFGFGKLDQGVLFDSHTILGFDTLPARLVPEALLVRPKL